MKIKEKKKRKKNKRNKSKKNKLILKPKKKSNCIIL